MIVWPDSQPGICLSCMNFFFLPPRRLIYQCTFSDGCWREQSDRQWEICLFRWTTIKIGYEGLDWSVTDITHAHTTRHVRTWTQIVSFCIIIQRKLLKQHRCTTDITYILHMNPAVLCTELKTSAQYSPWDSEVCDSTLSLPVPISCWLWSTGTANLSSDWIGVVRKPFQWLLFSLRLSLLLLSLPLFIKLSCRGFALAALRLAACGGGAVFRMMPQCHCCLSKWLPGQAKKAYWQHRQW